MLSWHNEDFARLHRASAAILARLMRPRPTLPARTACWRSPTTPCAPSTSTPQAARPKPVAARPGAPLDDAERRHAGALMRVNHVGEVCAQALYSAQALATSDPALRRQFERAAGEETDHLAWTAERLAELGARPSLLNPLWYAGAFGDRPARGPGRRRDAASAFWSRPSARSSVTSTVTSSGCPPATSSRARSSRR